MSYGHGRFEDALYQQTQQLRFLESPEGQRYMNGFQDDWAGKRKLGWPPGFLWKITYDTLRDGDPIYVSPDVTEIIDEAMRTFEPEPILKSDPFVPCGFAYFPRSIVRPDRRGKENGVRAVAWQTVTDNAVPVAPDDDRAKGLWISLFSHETDANGDELLDYRLVHPLFELQYLHGTFMPFEEDGWLLEKGIDLKTDDTLDPEVVEATARNQWVLPQVLWRIGQQIVPVQERAQRQFRRDARRHGLERDEVAVLRLRRSNIRYDGEPEGEGNWSHRWMVRGHWRNAWYPSLKQHRQVWIAPHVKGPDDKPLILKDRAVEFVR